MEYKNNSRKNIGFIHDNSGETLIEVITSVAVFAITMVLVATLFTTSSRIFGKNYRTEQRLNEQINELEMDQVNPVEDDSKYEIKFEYTPEAEDSNSLVDGKISKELELVGPISEKSGLAKIILAGGTP